MSEERTKNGLTRRRFIKSTIAGAGAVAMMGLSAREAKSIPLSTVTGKWDAEADVVVVGAGGAGLAAAVGAATEGVNTLVLEKMRSVLTCSTAVCGGFIIFAGTDLQNKLGIQDSKEVLYRDILNYGETSIPKVVKTFVENQLSYYELIKGIGVPFVDAVSPSPGCSVPRSHTVNPAKHVLLLEKTAKKKGVKFLFQTAGKRLITNSRGEVVGITAESDGRKLHFKAKRGVILATGGFTRNSEMLDECIPGLGKVIAFSAPGHTGDGHKAAFELGGVLRGRPTIYSVQGMYPTFTTMKGFAELFLFGAIQVNKEGERFVREDEYWSNRRTRLVLEQPKEKGIPILYQILDQKGFEKAEKAGPPIGLSETTKKLLVKANTIEELGLKMRAERLAQTVDRLNRDIDTAGYDTVFGRKTMVGKGTPKIEKIDSPPFYAFKNTAWLAYNPTVSLKVDENMTLVNVFDQAVPRIFLAGEIMLRCVCGDHYMYGLATGAGGTLGMVAGKNAGSLEPWE